MDDLAIPNPPQGMLRKGSPVVVDGVWGVIVQRYDDCWHVATWDSRTALFVKHHRPVLDLTDVTGRAHAAWWALGSTDARHWEALHIGVALWIAPVNETDRIMMWRILRKAGRIHDLLNHLDRADPRTLLDGSRWVDAEALRLVCLHLMEKDDDSA